MLLQGIKPPQTSWTNTSYIRHKMKNLQGNAHLFSRQAKRRSTWLWKWNKDGRGSLQRKVCFADGGHKRCDG